MQAPDEPNVPDVGGGDGTDESAEEPGDVVEENETLEAPLPEAEVLLPTAPIEPIELVSQSGFKVKISLPFTETADVGPLQVDDGVVAFGNAGFVSVPVAKTDGSVQILAIVEARTAPERYPFRLSLPSGVTATSSEDGGIHFVSSSGEFNGGIAPPWAEGADGQPLNTWYEVSGDTATQVIDHRGSEALYPVVADPWLGIDLFGYTGYNRKGKYRNQVVVSAKLSAWGWYWYGTGGGMAILLTAGWSELVKKRPQADDKPSLRHQYECHVVFGWAVWLA